MNEVEELFWFNQDLLAPDKRVCPECRGAKILRCVYCAGTGAYLDYLEHLMNEAGQGRYNIIPGTAQHIRALTILYDLGELGLRELLEHKPDNVTVEELLAKYGRKKRRR